MRDSPRLPLAAAHKEALVPSWNVCWSLPLPELRMSVQTMDGSLTQLRDSNFGLHKGQ